MNKHGNRVALEITSGIVAFNAHHLPDVSHCDRPILKAHDLWRAEFFATRWALRYADGLVSIVVRHKNAAYTGFA